MEIFVSGKSLPQAYHRALAQLKYQGEIVPCPAWSTSCLEAGMTIYIEEPLAEPMISKCFIGGPAELQQYIMEMLDGILDFEIERGNWAYTYHDRMVHYGEYNQIDFVINELISDPDSRRAVIMIRNQDDIGSNDPACLQHIQYFIRGGKLDCKVLFRSNDACKANFMNMFALIMLQKRIADKLGVEMGTYTHRANSFHCYEKDFDMLNGYVTNILSDKTMTIDYQEDWKEIMDEEIDNINEKVRRLREGV